MVSIERLFCLISPQAISAEPIYGKGRFSREDAAGVVGMVQHAGYAVGVNVLESKIGGNAGAKTLLIGTLTLANESNGVEPTAARALAEIAVHEVCGSCVCHKCKGVGTVYSKRYQQIYTCSRCEGTGHKNSSMRDFAEAFSALTHTSCSTPEFRKQHYDRLMDAIDSLYREEGEAARQCAKVLKLIEVEVE